MTIEERCSEFFGSEKFLKKRTRIIIALIVIRVLLVIVMVTILVHAFRAKGDAADELFRWSGLIAAVLASLSVPELIIGGFEKHYASTKTTIKTVVTSSDGEGVNVETAQSHQSKVLNLPFEKR